jgi:D-glycero-D-manno-heptose 1,7-bisphosphate phosphatase
MRMIWSAKKNPGGAAIFIDRDGVINYRRPDDYVLNWNQFVFVEGIREALGKLASLQLPMILISNQSAVGRGLMEPAMLEKITERMRTELQQNGAVLDAAYFCLHRPDEDCPCRKPKPELLRNAAADFEVDLTRSVFIGDSNTDVKAARAAGCQPVLFGAGHTAGSASQEWRKGVPVVATAKDLFSITSNALRSVEHGTPDLFTDMGHPVR